MPGGRAATTNGPSQENAPVHVQARHLGQKYLGSRPKSHFDTMFEAPAVGMQGNHPVPVSNFMNAQCMYDEGLFADLC